jgi:hypothetical protein
MQAGNDTAGMNKPADVVATVFNALEAGEDEVITDETAERVYAALSRPVTALYPSPASGLRALRGRA